MEQETCTNNNIPHHMYEWERTMKLTSSASEQNVYLTYVCLTNDPEPNMTSNYDENRISFPYVDAEDVDIEDEPIRVERTKALHELISSHRKEANDGLGGTCIAETELTTPYPLTVSEESEVSETEERNFLSVDNANILTLTKMKWLTEEQDGAPDSSSPSLSPTASSTSSDCSFESQAKHDKYNYSGDKYLSTILRLDKEHNMFGLSNIAIFGSKPSKKIRKDEDRAVFHQTAIVQICCGEKSCVNRSNTDLPFSLKCSGCRHCYVDPSCLSCLRGRPCGLPCHPPCDPPCSPPCLLPCDPSYGPPCLLPCGPSYNTPCSSPCSQPCVLPCGLPYGQPCGPPCLLPCDPPCGLPCDPPCSPRCGRCVNPPCQPLCITCPRGKCTCKYWCRPSKCVIDCNTCYGMKILLNKKPKYDPVKIELTPRSSSVLHKPNAARSCHHLPQCIPPSSCFPYLMPCFWPARSGAPCSNPSRCFHNPPCPAPRRRRSRIPPEDLCPPDGKCGFDVKDTKCPNIFCPGSGCPYSEMVLMDKKKKHKKKILCECSVSACANCFVMKPTVFIPKSKSEEITKRK